MKNALQIFIILSLFLHACKPNQPKESSTDLLTKYITTRGPETISVNDQIMIRFKQEISEEKKEITKDYISLSPQTDFSVSWNGDHELIIKPNSKLSYGQGYSVIVNTESLFNTPDEDIVIGFKTFELTISCTLENLKHSYNGGEELTSLSGQIVSSDDISKNAVIDALQVKQKDNKDLTVDWVGNEEGRSFLFTIYGIERFDEASALNISYDLTNLDRYAKYDKTISVPPISDFVFTGLSQDKYDASLMTLVFSRALEANQNLSGLIQSKDGNFEYKSEIVDNTIRVYPERRITDNLEIIISEYIKDYTGQQLGKSYSESINVILEKPEVKLLGSGVISPMKNEVVFPFQAKNLDAVDVEVFKIYENNVLQFLQYNRLDNTYGQREVGKIIYQDSIPLNRTLVNQFEPFYFDLRKMIDLDPGAIYQVRIAFRQHYALTNCEMTIAYHFTKDMTKSIMRSYRNYEGFKWAHVKDPCYPAYYNQDLFVSRNILGSNLAIIAKRPNPDRLSVKLLDYTNASELQSGEIQVYNFQQQLIASSEIQSGTADIVLTEKADFIVAKYNNQYAYLRLQDYDALSMTNFDVAGKSRSDGVDGFIYTERGVWRPGDTMFVSFILDNPELENTENYPIKLTVNDSRGTKRFVKTTTDNSGGLYVFAVPTDITDPTGNWKARIAAGDNTFYKSLKVETIKPNRLKINVDQEAKGELDISQGKTTFQFNSSWLHGAPAKGLKAKVEAQFVHKSLSFKNFGDYNFMDYSVNVDSRVFNVFDSKLDNTGHAEFSIERPPSNSIRGKLAANFRIRVFEESGNASEDNFSINLNPFTYYVGVQLPKTEWYSQSYGLGSKQTFRMVSVNKEGEPVSNRSLRVGIYKNSEYWWYRQNGRNNYSFANGKHIGAIGEYDVVTDGSGQTDIVFDCKDAGSFTVRVCDPKTGHCTSNRFYVRNYYDDTELSFENKTEISKVFLTKDKEEHITGETASINIPSYKGAKILVSVELQDRILYQEWITGEENETVYKLKCTEDMTPNVYVNVNIIQAHGQTNNNMPLRMYGVIPVKVYDKKTKLEPNIEMAEVLRPLEKYSIGISEKANREMHYTLAVVDEGLLDITNFSTPDPFNHFYAKQALLLKTWDNFDMILNGFNTNMSRVLTIGGDGDVSDSTPPKKANRFKPVVRFIGPFHLEAGQKKMHELDMDNYVGSVKIMCVAREKESYGYTDKTVPVKQPLMILATAPRVIGPEETFSLPVTVFAMDNKINKVKISLETDNQFTINGLSQKDILFEEVGDQIVNFNVSVKDLIGIGKFKVTAVSGKEKMSQEIEIDIRNPNPYITNVLDELIGAKASVKSPFELVGVEGANEVVLELSTFPAIDFDRRLKYLIRYPYGCLEQTTSSAFPQLFMDNIVELTDDQKRQKQHNIEQAIRQIGKFKLSDGSFSYWIGENRKAEWAFTYAIHFLIEAKNKGFYVPRDLLDEGVTALERTVKTLDIDALWSKRTKDEYFASKEAFYQMHYTNQAYRSYVLALYNHAVFPAMNLLKSEDKLNRTARAFLAGAYQLSNKNNIAKELLVMNTNDDWYADYDRYTYGSSIRNKSISCMVLNQIGQEEDAAQLAMQIAQSLGSRNWYSTQSTAFGLMAVSKFLGASKREPLNLVFEVGDGGKQTITSDKPVFYYKLNEEELLSKTVTIENVNDNKVFMRLIMSGQPAKTNNESYEKGLEMSVVYKDDSGKAIDPTTIVQGTDFYADITIKNKSTDSYINNLALSQIFPSGWEIMNTRMDAFSNDNNYRVRYQDFRDDRVYSFFNLGTKPVQIQVKLNASYPGEYYLPDVFCEAMYDNSVQARVAGKKVNVLPASK